MAQINFYTYLSQTTWTIILFFSFYFLMKQYILPFVFENLKIKNKFLALNSEKGQNSTVLPKGQELNFLTIYNNSISALVEPK